VARYREATTEGVQHAAGRILAFDRRVMLSAVPAGQRELALADSMPVSVS